MRKLSLSTRACIFVETEAVPAVDPVNIHDMKRRSFKFQLLFLFLLSLFSKLSSQETLLQLTTTADSLQCHGDDNGELFWTINGGIAPYTFEWRRLSSSFVFSGGSQPNPGPGGPIGGNLEATTYILTVEDAAGNTSTDTIEIGEPARILVTDIALGDVSCASLCDGFVDITFAGGTGQLSTSWNDSPAEGAYRDGLCAGEYVFVVQDERGCRQKGNIPISEPPPIEVEADFTVPVCAGLDDGSITLTSSGGTGEHTYTWPGGSSGATLASIEAGQYVATVMDEAGCTEELEISLPDGPVMSANLNYNYGCGDGRLIVSSQPVNGTEPFIYEWSTGSNLPFLYQMSAGNYSLSLTDANGCTDELDFTLAYVPPLEVEEAVQDASCPGAADGAINLDISGGMPPYGLSWTDNNNNTNRTNMESGTYQYNINASGCGYAGVVQVNEPQALAVQLDYTPLLNGTINVTAYASGGTPQYTYQWSNGSAGTTAIGLDPTQLYWLTVTDANGCSSEWEVDFATTTVATIAEDDPQVYPNPGGGLFTVAFPGAAQPCEYFVFDQLGRVIREGKSRMDSSFRLDLKAEPAGTYFLVINTPAGRHSEVLFKW